METRAAARESHTHARRSRSSRDEAVDDTERSRRPSSEEAFARSQIKHPTPQPLDDEGRAGVQSSPQQASLQPEATQTVSSSRAGRPYRDMCPPSPRDLRISGREQKKRSIVSSASLDFTALSACDIAMMDKCQSGKVHQQNATSLDAFQLPALKRSRPNSKAESKESNPSEPKSSASQEVSSVGLDACLKLRVRDIFRPQSSRGGSIHSSLGQAAYSAKPTSFGSSLSRPMSNPRSLGSSLGSLCGLSAGTTNLATETPPSAPSAFEAHKGIHRALVRLTAKAALSGEARRRQCFSRLSGSDDSLESGAPVRLTADAYIPGEE